MKTMITNDTSAIRYKNLVVVVCCGYICIYAYCMQMHPNGSALGLRCLMNKIPMCGSSKKGLVYLVCKDELCRVFHHCCWLAAHPQFGFQLGIGGIGASLRGNASFFRLQTVLLCQSHSTDGAIKCDQVQHAVSSYSYTTCKPLQL